MCPLFIYFFKSKDIRSKEQRVENGQKARNYEGPKHKKLKRQKVRGHKVQTKKKIKQMKRFKGQ